MLAQIFSVAIIFLQSLFDLNIPAEQPFISLERAVGSFEGNHSVMFSPKQPPNLSRGEFARSAPGAKRVKLSFASVEQTFIAQIEANPIFPFRRVGAPEIEIDAAAAIALDANSGKILYQKNIHQKLPIASLTKLMTASVILENNNLDDVITISKRAVETYGEMGNLIVGEKITIKNLLYILLMESSNDAAIALEENLRENKNLELIDLMNKKAGDLRLNNTFFNDSSGLDKNDVSSAWDLSQITKYTFKQNLIWDILQANSIDIYSANNRTHRLNTTNKLLGKLPEMLGGKTGYTEEAGECMMAAIQMPKIGSTGSPRGDKIILVILGAKDRFGEIEKLINWIKKTYVF